MIVFLNFAPFNFAGGAERWMLDVASALRTTEKVVLIDVHSGISNLYGKLVLKQSYDQRIKIKADNNHISLKLLSFIPFTSPWKKAKEIIHNSRLIYIRFELLESLIVYYFGSNAALKKTIAGIHSPLIYQKPISYLDHVHNLLYSSFLSKWFLSKMKKVHAVKPQDLKFFENNFRLKNVVQIPNYIDLSNNKYNIKKSTTDKLLHIAFIGELNTRKGADILFKTMQNMPGDFVIHIAGDGPYKKVIKELSRSKNIKYYGYLNKEKIKKLYSNCDILFAPSRAEVFSLVWLEAMSYGIPIISSSETDLGLPDYVQKVNNTGSVEEYINIFTVSLDNKRDGKLIKQKNKIREYARNTFSRNIILPQLQKQLFNKL